MEQIITNPIYEKIKTSMASTSNEIKIAVPFITAYAKSFLEFISDDVGQKKLLVRIDESNIFSYDIPTILQFAKNGFEVKFNNDIHLKLYILGSDTYVTSSNFTKRGFEKGVELTVQVDESNNTSCNKIFESIWQQSANISIEELTSLLPKYNLLKKLSKSIKPKPPILETKKYNAPFDIAKFIEATFKYIEMNEISLLGNQSNQIMQKLKKRIINNQFEIEDFYVHKGHPKRNSCLWYQIIYGVDTKLASTGLREEFFIAVANSKSESIIEVLQFILPESMGLKPWDLTNPAELEVFCNGLFDFDIPFFKEAIPIRLASYFHKEIFPIFKLTALNEISQSSGMQLQGESKGETLYLCTRHLNELLSSVNSDIHLKAKIGYLIHTAHTILKTPEYEPSKKWERENFEIAKKSLGDL